MEAHAADARSSNTLIDFRLTTYVCAEHALVYMIRRGLQEDAPHGRYTHGPILCLTRLPIVANLRSEERF